MTDNKPATISIPRFHCDQCDQPLSDDMQEAIRQCCEQVAHAMKKIVGNSISEKISENLIRLFQEWRKTGDQFPNIELIHEWANSHAIKSKKNVRIVSKQVLRDENGFISDILEQHEVE